MSDPLKFESLALHAGHTVDETNARGVPVHRTSSYVFRDTDHASNLFALKEPGNIYTRIMNPTQDVLEKRVAELEGGAAALALASGTAAVFYSIINICKAGNEVVSANNLYGGTYTMFNDILPDLGIKTVFVNALDLAAVESAINDDTRVLFVETIGNPALDVVNMRDLADIAKKHHIPLPSPPDEASELDDGLLTASEIARLNLNADLVILSSCNTAATNGTPGAEGLSGLAKAFFLQVAVHC